MFVADSLLDRLFQAIALLYLMEFLIKFTSGQFLHLILIIMGRQNLHNYVQERNRWTFDLAEGMHWELQPKCAEPHLFTRKQIVHLPG